jgi:hypothetical protein
LLLLAFAQRRSTAASEVFAASIHRRSVSASTRSPFLPIALPQPLRLSVAHPQQGHRVHPPQLSTSNPRQSLDPPNSLLLIFVRPNLTSFRRSHERTFLSRTKGDTIIEVQQRTTSYIKNGLDLQELNEIRMGYLASIIVLLSSYKEMGVFKDWLR